MEGLRPFRKTEMFLGEEGSCESQVCHPKQPTCSCNLDKGITAVQSEQYSCVSPQSMEEISHNSHYLEPSHNELVHHSQSAPDELELESLYVTPLPCSWYSNKTVISVDLIEEIIEVMMMCFKQKLMFVLIVIINLD